MLPSMGGWEFVILALVLVLLFGAAKLPTLARSVGQSMRIFKAEARGMKQDQKTAEGEPAEPAAPQQLPPAQPVQQAPQQQNPQVAQPAPQTQAKNNGS